MANEAEWRRIGYEQSLGRQGIRTGTIVNDYAYKEFKQKQASQGQAQADWTAPAPKPQAPSPMPPPQIDGAGPSSVVGGPMGRSRHEYSSRPTRGTSGGPFVGWFLTHVWPLSMASALGDWLVASTWKLRLPTALFAAFVAAVIGANPGADAAPWVLGAGALVGWMAPSILGGALLIAAHLVAFILAALTVVFVMLLAYIVIVSLASNVSSERESAVESPSPAVDSVTPSVPQDMSLPQ